MIDKIADCIRTRQAAYLVAAFALAYYACFLFHDLMLGRDAAMYFLLGRSLAQGAGYTDLFRLPVTPHTYYPPGYPYILSLVMRLCGQNPVFSRIASLALTGASLAVLIRLLSVSMSRKKVLFIVAVFAFNPLLLNIAPTVNSEAPYFLFSWLSLYFFTGKNSRFSWGGVCMGALCAAAAFYMRSVGFALCLAAALYLLIKRKYLQAAAASCIMLLAALPWLLHIIKNADGSYFQTVMHKDYYEAYLGAMRMGDIPLRCVLNARYYLGKVASDLVVFPFLYGATFGNAFFYVKVAASVFFSFLFLRGFFTCLRQGVRVTELYILVYGAALLAHSFHSERFLVPVYPFLIGYAIISLRAFPWRPKDAVLVAGVCGWLLVSNAAMVAQSFARPDPFADSFRAACVWMKTSVADDERIMALDFAEVYLYTNKKTLKWELVSDNASASVEVLREKKARYLVVQEDMGLILKGKKVPGLKKYIGPIEEQYPGVLRLAWRSANHPRILIYEVNIP